MGAARLVRVISLVLLAATPALAQAPSPVTSARETAKQGIEAFDAGDFRTAAALLGDAYSVVKVPTLALYRARSLVQLGRLVEAAELYHEATRLPVSGTQEEIQRAAQRDAATERAALLPRIPRLSLEVTGAKLEELGVEVDGQPLPAVLLRGGVLLDPGAHGVVVRLADQLRDEQITLGEAELRTLRVEFERRPSPVAAPAMAGPGPTAVEREQPAKVVPAAETRRPSPQRNGAYVALGIGGAALALGAAELFEAARRRGELDADGCDDGRCPLELEDEVRQYNRAVLLSQLGLVVGGITATTGLVLLLTAPRHSRADRARIEAFVGPGRAGLRATF